MIFIERYPLKRCQGCVKLIASKVNCFLNITDLSEVQLCMSSNSWTWECPHTKDGAKKVFQFTSLRREKREKKLTCIQICRLKFILKTDLYQSEMWDTMIVFIRD